MPLKDWLSEEKARSRPSEAEERAGSAMLMDEHASAESSGGGAATAAATTLPLPLLCARTGSPASYMCGSGEEGGCAWLLPPRAVGWIRPAWGDSSALAGISGDDIEAALSVTERVDRCA